MVYRSTEFEPGVCIKRPTTENGNADYKYILVYVNDVLLFAKETKEYMLTIY